MGLKLSNMGYSNVLMLLLCIILHILRFSVISTCDLNYVVVKYAMQMVKICLLVVFMSCKHFLE